MLLRFVPCCQMDGSGVMCSSVFDGRKPSVHGLHCRVSKTPFLSGCLLQASSHHEASTRICVSSQSSIFSCRCASQQIRRRCWERGRLPFQLHRKQLLHSGPLRAAAVVSREPVSALRLACLPSAEALCFRPRPASCALVPTCSRCLRGTQL